MLYEVITRKAAQSERQADIADTRVYNASLREQQQKELADRQAEGRAESEAIAGYNVHVLAEQEAYRTDLRESNSNRITSYNVCYTKLLRRQ